MERYMPPSNCNFITKKQSLIASGFIALATAQAAQAETTEKDHITLEAVRITAKAAQIDMPEPTEPKELPEELKPESPRNAFRLPQSSNSHTQTIKRDEIEKLRPRDIFELLNTGTGVVATQGSRKGFSGLTIRGDSNFRFIVDGAYLQPTMASRIMSALPVTAIEEVKIVRGSSALTMGPMTGSASPGGAPVDGFVIIRTRKPMEDGGQARVAGESYDGVKADLWYGKTLGADQNKGYVAGLVSHSRSQGPNDKLNNNATYNRARETTDGLLKSGYSGHGLLVDFMFYKDEGSFQIPNANSHGSGQGNWFMDPSQTEIYAMSGSQTWDDIHTTLFNVSHSTSNQRFWTSATPVQNDNEVTHVNLRHNMDIDKTRVMVGGDYFYWNAPNGQQYYEGIPREEMTAGWFAQIEQKLFDDKLTLDGSYRGDQVDVIRGLDYYTGGAQPPGGVDTTLKTRNKTLPVATFFSVGAGYEFIKGWKLTGRYGEASVASSGLNAVPGTVLKDDEQFKYEVGIQGEWLPLINPSLNYFHRESANEKTLYGYTFIANNNSTRSCAPGVLPSTGPNAPKLNATLDPCYTQTNTVRDGIEFTLSGNLGLNTSYRASITSFTHLVNAASITPSEIIDFSFRHRLSILSRQFTLSGAFKYLPAYQGALTDATAYLGDYTRYDFGIGYDFNLGKLPITTTLYGQNLTDERYETSNGVPDIGRILGVELMTNF